MKDESRNEIQIDDNWLSQGEGGGCDGRMCQELLLQISPPPLLLMRMSLFCNIKDADEDKRPISGDISSNDIS